MKRILLLIVFIQLILTLHARPLSNSNDRLPLQIPPNPAAFITTWVTDIANDSIVIPINPQYNDYNYSVDWGDGVVSTSQSSNATHTYATAGEHTVTITGNFPAIKFGAEVSQPINDGKLKSVDQWGTQIWKGMNEAFKYCTNLISVPNSVGPIFAPGSTLYSMFYDCLSLTGDLNNWDLSNVRETSFMFANAASFNGDISNWDMSSVINMQGMFQFAKSFNQDISGWDVSKVTLMDRMFYHAEKFNSVIADWDVSKVETMDFMFNNAKAFNQDIGSWDVSSVKNMNGIFFNANAFDQDLSRWNVSNVTDFGSAFSKATSFNQGIGGWDVSSATVMAGMFKNAVNFNQDIGDWNVENVVSMTAMFNGAGSFNQDLSKWDVSGVISMGSMFGSAYAFDQNLGSWQISAVTDMEGMLILSGLSINNYEATLNGWAEQSVTDGIYFDAEGLKYCELTGRQSLIDNHHWRFSGDRQVCLVPAVPDGSGIVYVDSANLQPGDGSSWENALNYLSNATESAQANMDIKEIHVAKGTYYPIGKATDTYRDSSFIISRSGLKLLGGFHPGGGTRDIDVYPTFLSGDIGAVDTLSDNSYHVLIITNVPDTDSLIIDGIKVAKGYADSRTPNNHLTRGRNDQGGGFIIAESLDNIVLRNCDIMDNHAITAAGMVIIGHDLGNNQIQFTSPLISNCVFKHNRTIGDMSYVSSEELFGGVILNAGAAPVIRNCAFLENEGKIGTAIANIDRSSPMIVNSTFSRNTAFGLSVMVTLYGSTVTIVNCLITDNLTTGRDTSGQLGNNLDNILGNAIFGNEDNATLRIINSTISGNHCISPTPLTGALIDNEGGSRLFITNSILWGNENERIDDTDGSTSTVTYSLIQGLAADTDNHLLDGTLDLDVFVDTASGDYRLNLGSPAIDAGINDSIVNIMYADVDNAGNLRIADGIVDLGAIESPSAPLPVKSSPLTGRVNNKGHVLLNWTTYSEVQNKGFQVQVSKDGVKFENSRFIASLAQDGNSTSMLQYSIDLGVLDGTKYYRFLQTDFNGHTTNSNIVRLQGNKAAFHLTAYPNPARDNIHVRVEGKMGSHPRIKVIDLSGRVLMTQKMSGNDSKMDLSVLASGIYFIKYIDDKQNSVIRIVKQ